MTSGLADDERVVLVDLDVTPHTECRVGGQQANYLWLCWVGDVNESCPILHTLEPAQQRQQRRRRQQQEKK